MASAAYSPQTRRWEVNLNNHLLEPSWSYRFAFSIWCNTKPKGETHLVFSFPGSTEKEELTIQSSHLTFVGGSFRGWAIQHLNETGLVELSEADDPDTFVVLLEFIRCNSVDLSQATVNFIRRLSCAAHYWNFSPLVHVLCDYIQKKDLFSSAENVIEFRHFADKRPSDSFKDYFWQGVARNFDDFGCEVRLQAAGARYDPLRTRDVTAFAMALCYRYRGLWEQAIDHDMLHVLLQGLHTHSIRVTDRHIVELLCQFLYPKAEHVPVFQSELHRFVRSLVTPKLFRQCQGIVRLCNPRLRTVIISAVTPHVPPCTSLTEIWPVNLEPNTTTEFAFHFGCQKHTLSNSSRAFEMNPLPSNWLRRQRVSEDALYIRLSIEVEEPRALSLSFTVDVPVRPGCPLRSRCLAVTLQLLNGTCPICKRNGSRSMWTSHQLRSISYGDTFDPVKTFIPPDQFEKLWGCYRSDHDENSTCVPRMRLKARFVVPTASRGNDVIAPSGNWAAANGSGVEEANRLPNEES